MGGRWHEDYGIEEIRELSESLGASLLEVSSVSSPANECFFPWVFSTVTPSPNSGYLLLFSLLLVPGSLGGVSS